MVDAGLVGYGFVAVVVFLVIWFTLLVGSE